MVKRLTSRRTTTKARLYRRRRPTMKLYKKPSNYASVVSRTVGCKMSMFPITGSINLRFLNIGGLPPNSATMASKLQIMVSCLFNAAEKDWFVWFETASPFDPAASSVASRNISQCFASTLDSNSFSGLNPENQAFLLDPRLSPFYKSEKYWCGGMKYQWCPNKMPRALFSNAQGVQDSFDYSVSLKTFYTCSPPPLAINVVKAGSAPTPYLDMLSSPFERKQSFGTDSVSGFIKNASPISPNTYAFKNDSIALANVTDMGTDLNEVDTAFRLKGSANFVFEISIPPVGTGIRFVGLDLGTLNIKKYFFAHFTGVYRNTFYNNGELKKEQTIPEPIMIEGRSPSPDILGLKKTFENKLLI